MLTRAISCTVWNRSWSRGVKRCVRGDFRRGIALGGRADEEAEFREFVERFSTTLLRAAVLLVRDVDAAQDAVQLTLLRTFRRWSRARHAPEAYSRRVLVNVCRNHWRHHRRHPAQAFSADDQMDALAAIDATGLVEQRMFLEQALAGLPELQREVLVLRFFLELPVAQVADVLSVPEGTVKSATHRGLGALRKLLTEQPQEVHCGH